MKGYFKDNTIENFDQTTGRLVRTIRTLIDSEKQVFKMVKTEYTYVNNNQLVKSLTEKIFSDINLFDLTLSHQIIYHYDADGNVVGEREINKDNDQVLEKITLYKKNADNEGGILLKAELSVTDNMCVKNEMEEF